MTDTLLFPLEGVDHEIVRVIHGKGTGTLREGVHRLLEKLPEVERYHLAGEGSGSWGATWVYLVPPGC